MPSITPIVLHSAGLTLETLALSVPTGTALAWLLVRTDLPGRRIGMWVVATMIFVPLYLQTGAWQAGFGYEGWYSTGSGQPWLAGWNAALWVHTLAAIPWIVLIAALGLRTVEPALEEQALLDGTPWQAFWRVTMPACWPALGLAAAWVAILTAGEMTVTSIFSVTTYAEEVFNQVALHDDTQGAAWRYRRASAAPWSCWGLHSFAALAWHGRSVRWNCGRLALWHLGAGAGRW